MVKIPAWLSPGEWLWRSDRKLTPSQMKKFNLGFDGTGTGFGRRTYFYFKKK